eukprot:TRINITY_DN7269_c0_g1_i2.p1 TRINITY_DN7269_c0_g1~~TRINITY_DN7269_c0_g1_i2.p1  ORF type:complete len:259 (+),score=75.15 TRINITY_DN7269_c0_g1_i2:19-795(+)
MFNWAFGNNNNNTTTPQPEVDDGKPSIRGYKLFIDEDFDKFINLCESDGPEWIECSKTDTLRITRRPDPEQRTSIDIIRVQATLDVDPETVVEVLENSNFRKEWDEKLLKNGLIEKLDESNNINYYAGAAPSPLSNRDFVTQKSHKYLYKEKRQWVMFNRSVTHEKVPEKVGFVRAHSFGTGNFVKENENGKAFVTYIAQADLKGWIPGWAVSWATSMTGPQLMANLENACKKFPEWKKNNPVNTPVYFFSEDEKKIK